MGSLVGDTVGLRASEKGQLEKLLSRRVRPDEVIGAELAKRAAQICGDASRALGLLIGRDGAIEFVIVGNKSRVYLPELGRFRLDSGRLRALRLVVFMPDGEDWYERYPKEPLQLGPTSNRRLAGNVLAPEIAADLLTDLEKLRLDAVLVVAVTRKSLPGAVSFAYLSPQETQNTRANAGAHRTPIGFLHRGDLSDLDFDFSELVAEIEATMEGSRTRKVQRGTDQAVLVGAYTAGAEVSEASMSELEELARTAGVTILDKVIQRRRSLDPKTVIGKGKIEELVLHCLDLGAEMLIFDRELTPGQLRSVSQMTELKVLDRSMLILDIFAQRAKSSEGRLQVELAQLKYSLPRLTERDSGLSRLSGGIGGRGPGETKLEIGRRRARDRINDLEKRIDKVSEQRGLRRERRQSRGVPVIAIVGYTNAGKSTLLNALTKGDVLVENKLFATLDTASRRMRFPNEKEVIFVDTVGFIRELPKELVAAFRATLEEVGEADVLLHVVEASSRELRQQIEVVEETLANLQFTGKPRIRIFNKTDLLSEIEVKALLNSYGGLAVSALHRKGFPALLSELQSKLHETFKGQDPGRFTEISSTQE